jgi:hypothetical protein
MILVVEDRSRMDPPAAAAPKLEKGSLQRTLRRMGFYAARPAPVRSSNPATAITPATPRWRGSDDAQ